MTDNKLLELAVGVVSSHVSNNAVSSSDLPELLKTIYNTLEEIEDGSVEEEELIPAVPIKKSVTEDKILCLECGKAGSVLKRHLQVAHGLDEMEYRQRWNLGSDYPLVAPAYSARRKELAEKIGLGKKKPKPTPRRRKTSSQ